MITSGIGWEWIFFVNVPIGIAAVALTLTQVSESRDPDARGVDWLGLLTFSGSLFLLVFALIEGNEKGWGSTRIVSFLVASAVLIVLFVIVERRQQRPMLDLTLFPKPAFAGATIVAFAISASMFSMFLYLTLYIQDVLGYGPLQAGPALPAGHVAVVLRRADLRAPVGTRPGAPAARLGLLLVGVGLLTMTAVDASSELDRAGARLPARRRRHRLDQPAAGLDRRRGRAPLRSGMASGINNTFRQVGIATGSPASARSSSTRSRTTPRPRWPAARDAKYFAPPTASSTPRSSPAKSGRSRVRCPCLREPR